MSRSMIDTAPAQVPRSQPDIALQFTTVERLVSGLSRRRFRACQLLGTFGGLALLTALGGRLHGRSPA